MRPAELDRLRRLSSFEIVGEDVSELQARECLGIERAMAVVDARLADAMHEPPRLLLVEREAGGADEKLDLHRLDRIGGPR